MITLTSNNLPERLTIRQILTEILSRQWKVQAYRANDPIAVITRPDGKRFTIYSSCPPTTSYIAASITNNKYLTHLALESVGLPVLQTFHCTTDDEAQLAAEAILTQGNYYVVKPLDASHGNGVTVRLSSLAALPSALDHARQYAATVVVQKYQPEAIDVRALCINGKVLSVVERIPARVTGDGEHTVKELIAIENTKRGGQYTTKLSTIPEDRAAAFLSEQYYAIPQKDAVVAVLGTANIGMGGESRDITDQVPQWLIDMSLLAAKTLNLPVCGVDFLLAEQPTPSAGMGRLQPSITEVNKCPSFFIHETPNHGVGRPVVGAYVDYLQSL